MKRYAYLQMTHTLRADDVADCHLPPLHTGEDGAPVTVFALKTPTGQTVAQLAVCNRLDGLAIAKHLNAALESTPWTEL